MSLNDKLWAEGKPAKEYPEDYIVIPVLDAMAVFREFIKALRLKTVGFILPENVDKFLKKVEELAGKELVE